MVLNLDIVKRMAYVVLNVTKFNVDHNNITDQEINDIMCFSFLNTWR